MNIKSITYDTVLDLCKHQHRRIVLGVLAEEQRSVALGDLTKAVLKYNHHTPIEKGSADVLSKIHPLLHQAHLPKLDTEGLIHYDSEKELVEPTEQFEQVQSTLATLFEADPSLDMPMEL